MNSWQSDLPKESIHPKFEVGQPVKIDKNGGKYNGCVGEVKEIHVTSGKPSYTVELPRIGDVEEVFLEMLQDELVAAKEPKISGYTLAKAAASMKRFGDILREDRPSPMMEDRPEMLMPEHFGPINEARLLVHKLHYGPSSETPLALHDVYVVWFCKTLQNWKAMVSSNAKDDAYYEVTHNGDKNETYVDRYIKETNTVYHNETGTTDVTLVNNFGRIW